MIHTSTRTPTTIAKKKIPNEAGVVVRRLRVVQKVQKRREVMAVAEAMVLTMVAIKMAHTRAE